MKKILPFGSELSFLIKNGFKPDKPIFLYIGRKAWEEGKEHFYLSPLNTLVLPPWLCPTLYYWPVKNCYVIVNDSGYPEKEYLGSLFDCLINYQVKSIVHVEQNEKITVYR